jgi:hypothetical protein
MVKMNEELGATPRVSRQSDHQEHIAPALIRESFMTVIWSHRRKDEINTTSL